MAVSQSLVITVEKITSLVVGPVGFCHTLAKLENHDWQSWRIFFFFSFMFLFVRTMCNGGGGSWSGWLAIVVVFLVSASYISTKTIWRTKHQRVYYMSLFCKLKESFSWWTVCVINVKVWPPQKKLPSCDVERTTTTTTTTKVDVHSKDTLRRVL